LGSSRLALDVNGNLYSGRAYAPFGETYAEAGAADRSFTGQTEDLIAGPNGIYDFLFRQHSSAQGRWLVPDPAGLAAVDLTNPQTWNRYAYVGNNPLSNVDPLGLYTKSACADGMPLWSCTGPSWWTFMIQGLPQYAYCAFTGSCSPYPPGGGGGGSVSPVPPGPKPPVMNPPKPPSNLAPRICSGSARVLQGNPDTIGRTGGFGNPVLANSAAVIPAQWGGAQNIRGSLFLIGGTTGTGSSTQTFHGLSDTIGSQDVPNVQTFLQNRFPNSVILELVSGTDQGTVPINLHVPPDISCPSFTTETGRAW
jgi:RHS repeat-associated protein